MNEKRISNSQHGPFDCKNRHQNKGSYWYRSRALFQSFYDFITGALPYNIVLYIRVQRMWPFVKSDENPELSMDAKWNPKTHLCAWLQSWSKCANMTKNISQIFNVCIKKRRICGWFLIRQKNFAMKIKQNEPVLQIRKYFFRLRLCVAANPNCGSSSE